MVEKSDSSDMLKYLKLVSNANISPETINESDYIDDEEEINSVAAPVIPKCSGQDYAYMKNILDKFKSASEGATHTLMEDSKIDPSIRESLSTKMLPNRQGAVVGSWEIRSSLLETFDTEKKYYTVTNTHTREVAAKDLALYEAALCLVKILNNGAKLVSAKVNEIKNLDEQFNRNRIDAMRFAKLYKRSKDLKQDDAASVFNSRYQTARANALAAKEQICSIKESAR